MGYMYYSQMAMIPADVDLSFELVYVLISEAFVNWKLPIDLTGSTKIEISCVNEWKYHIGWNDSPSVTVEAQEIAEIFAKARDDKEIIASSTRFISIWGDPDPNMNHFDVYLQVLGLLESIPNIYHFDNIDGLLYKSGEDKFGKAKSSNSDE
jgi:hypothetical protein